MPNLLLLQKSGVLVNQNNPVGWRGDSALQDAGNYALQGGFYDGAAPGPSGVSAAVSLHSLYLCLLFCPTALLNVLACCPPAGGDNMKFTYPIATSVAFLAWSMREFQDGYK